MRSRATLAIGLFLLGQGCSALLDSDDVSFRKPRAVQPVTRRPVLASNDGSGSSYPNERETKPLDAAMDAAIADAAMDVAPQGAAMDANLNPPDLVPNPPDAVPNPPDPGPNLDGSSDGGPPDAEPPEPLRLDPALIITVQRAAG